MSYIINLLEALIVSYGLVELCNIDKKKIFFVLNTVITFLVSQIFDFINMNYLPLTLIDEILWFIVVVLFTKKFLFHDLYIVTMMNLICDLSASLPIMFIYQYNSIYAGLVAKIINLFLTLGFVWFRKNMIILKVNIG